MTESSIIAQNILEKWKKEVMADVPKPEVYKPKKLSRNAIIARQMRKTASYEALEFCRRLFPWRCLS